MLRQGIKGIQNRRNGVVVRSRYTGYACPICDAEYGATPEKAGHNHNCGHCKTDVLIPVGLRPSEVSVGDSPGKKLSPQETEAPYNTTPVRMAMARPMVPPLLIPDDINRTQHLPSPTHRPEGDDKPVALRLGRKIGMKVDVDGKTRNAMANTFLGGILVVLGTIIALRFGVKTKS